MRGPLSFVFLSVLGGFFYSPFQELSAMERIFCFSVKERLPKTKIVRADNQHHQDQKEPKYVERQSYFNTYDVEL